MVFGCLTNNSKHIIMKKYNETGVPKLYLYSRILNILTILTIVFMAISSLKLNDDVSILKNPRVIVIAFLGLYACIRLGYYFLFFKKIKSKIFIQTENGLSKSKMPLFHLFSQTILPFISLLLGYIILEENNFSFGFSSTVQFINWFTLLIGIFALIMALYTLLNFKKIKAIYLGLPS
jgi:hypothetical protein